jgi:ABC-2 type transport system ATP-binding protein
VTATVAQGLEQGAAAVAPCAAVRGLGKRYGDVVAVAGVSFEVRPGEAVGLLGPNGAGKTTTVKALMGLTAPTTGTVELFGHPPTDRAARVRVGYLPELFRFPEWLSGREVLALHAALAGVPAGARARRVDEVLERVGLGARGDDRVRGYSKGMSQRLGLAQALLAHPSLVVLDEPTSALDPLGRRLVREIIGELTADGVAVLLNSHLLAEVEQVCDRIVILDRGTVRWSGELAELVRTATRVLVRVEAVGPELAARLARHGEILSVSAHTVRMEVAGPGVAADVAATVVGAGHRLLELRTEQSTLEDRYVQLVTEGDR